jgi:methylmalonyl-CoA mutase N-terminal domain/subunit
MNNLIRVAYENMASVLGGVQSIFTAAWDEPFALPTQESTTLALRTQQILAYETGAAKVVDPLGGSYFIEGLTDSMEERIVEVMDGIERYGGMVRAVEQGYIQQLISQEAYRFQQQLEMGEHQVVGVNMFTTDDPPPDIHGYAMDENSASMQLERLADVKSSRDDAKVRQRLDDLAKGSEQDTNLMPLLLECAREYCTVGEITSVLKGTWGEYVQPVVF